jgi:hypothetical protein
LSAGQDSEIAMTCSQVRVLYIGGVGRSGSTLVERILGELPGVYGLGEVTQLWTRVMRNDMRCGCGAPYARCDFWTAVGESAFGGWREVDLNRIPTLQRTIARTRSAARLVGPRLAGDRSALIAEYADYYARIYAAAAAVTGARIVIDSSKNPALAFSLRWANDVDLRVVHLLRDPRGVAYSWTKQISSCEVDGEPMLARFSPAVSALEWSANNAAMSMLAWIGRRAAGQTTTLVPVRRIRYEEFLAHPRDAVRSLAAFGGLSVTDTDLSYLNDDYVDLGAVHGVAGNPMRFSSGRVPLRRDDTWRIAFPVLHRRLVGALCAPLLVAYGYPLIAESTVDAPHRRS